MNYVGNEPAPAGMVLVGDTNPVGAIAFFHAPPDGSWARLNGQSLIKANYPDLWAYAQGFLTANQAANPGLYRDVDANTFAVPNLDGLFIRGVGGAAAALGVLQAQDIGPHVHVQKAGDLLSPFAQSGSGAGGRSSDGAGAGTTGPSTVASTGLETRPVNVALVACVKALRSVLMPAAAMPTPALSLLHDKTFAGVANIDFAGLTGYASYRFILDSVTPSVAATLFMKCSTNNGVAYDDTNSYGYQAGGLSNGAVVNSYAGPGTASAIVVAAPISPAASHGVSGEVFTNSLKGNAAGGTPYFFYSLGWWDNAGFPSQRDGAALYSNAANVNAVRFTCAPGTLSGRILCFGMRGAS